MNFSRDDEHFKKWCATMGVNPQMQPQYMWPKVFECMNKLMAPPVKVEAPAVNISPTVERQNFDTMGDQALREFLTANGKKPHHMAKRETSARRLSRPLKLFNRFISSSRGRL